MTNNSVYLRPQSSLVHKGESIDNTENYCHITAITIAAGERYCFLTEFTPCLLTYGID